MEDLLFNQVTFAGLAVWLIQKLKASKLAPWITEATSTVNRVVGVIVAALSASGILVIVNWTGFETGGLSVIMNGLTLPNIGLFLWKAIGSFVFQQTGWNLLKAASALKAEVPLKVAQAKA